MKPVETAASIPVSVSKQLVMFKVRWTYYAPKVELVYGPEPFTGTRLDAHAKAKQLLLEFYGPAKLRLLSHSELSSLYPALRFAHLGKLYEPLALVAGYAVYDGTHYYMALVLELEEVNDAGKP
ncbi:hypothetical protein [Thermus phage TSP4]|nr:hypothetical protein [Thermus phage TSP4]